MMVFTIFCCLVAEKIKLKVLAFSFQNYFLIFKFLPVTRFKDPKVGILTLKMHTGSRLRFCKIIPETACDNLILVHFPCSQ
jgi:hypothetical protein